MNGRIEFKLAGVALELLDDCVSFEITRADGVVRVLLDGVDASDVGAALVRWGRFLLHEAGELDDLEFDVGPEDSAVGL